MTLASDLSTDQTIFNISSDEVGREQSMDALVKLSVQVEKKMERLAESRDRFGAVLDAMKEGVIALDENHCVSLVNQSACQLLGWSVPPINQQIDECIQDETLRHFLREETAEQDPWVEVELSEKRTALARLTSHPSRDELVLVLNDITALRRLETVRRDFVANVSHELRTPTTVIRANAETLVNGAMEEPIIAKQFLDGIERNAHRLSNLVSDLLDLSRIESGTYQLSTDTVDPLPVVHGVVDALADKIVSKQIKLKLKLNQVDSLICDSGALEQIFTNLVENAVHYSFDRGKVIIKATKTTPKDLDKDFIKFEVSDDGPGISEQHQTRIFERFYRVDKGRSRQLGGTGLGLAIVKHLCVAMGGEVGVESVAGEGSTFWFIIPCSQ